MRALGKLHSSVGTRILSLTEQLAGRESDLGLQHQHPGPPLIHRKNSLGQPSVGTSLPAVQIPRVLPQRAAAIYWSAGAPHALCLVGAVGCIMGLGCVVSGPAPIAGLAICLGVAALAAAYVMHCRAADLDGLILKRAATQGKSDPAKYLTGFCEQDIDKHRAEAISAQNLVIAANLWPVDRSRVLFGADAKCKATADAPPMVAIGCRVDSFGIGSKSSNAPTNNVEVASMLCWEPDNDTTSGDAPPDLGQEFAGRLGRAVTSLRFINDSAQVRAALSASMDFKWTSELQQGRDSDATHSSRKLHAIATVRLGDQLYIANLGACRACLLGQYSVRYLSARHGDNGPANSTPLANVVTPAGHQDKPEVVRVRLTDLNNHVLVIASPKVMELIYSRDAEDMWHYFRGGLGAQPIANFLVSRARLRGASGDTQALVLTSSLSPPFKPVYGQ